jgi:hypothetical protein
MERTPEGRATIARGQAVADRVKDGIRAGVKAALDAIDTESRGGISLLAGGMASGDVGAMTAGASSLFNAVFTCVHEEVFEAALGQHSIPGAHAVGTVASSVAVRAEQALLKAIAWSWSKMRGEKGYPMYADKSLDELTEADRALLAALARVAGQAIRDVLTAAGVGDVEIDEEAAAERIARALTGERKSGSQDLDMANANLAMAKTLSRQMV